VVVGTDDAALRHRLRHVYWIGGAPAAGKSTMATRLAARYGLTHYSTDDAMPGHARRTTPADAPYLHRFAAMGMDERWATRSPQVMLDTFHWYRGEGFHLIVEDLLRLPEQPGVVVDGFRLLPRLVQPLLRDPAHAVWLLPSVGFRRAAADSRGSLWSIPGRTGDPERALANLAERDRLFTERLRTEVAELGLPGIEVDTTLTEEALAGRIATMFGF
jgi:hypothetical protein